MSCIASTMTTCCCSLFRVENINAVQNRIEKYDKRKSSKYSHVTIKWAIRVASLQ